MLLSRKALKLRQQMNSLTLKDQLAEAKGKYSYFKQQCEVRYLQGTPPCILRPDIIQSGFVFQRMLAWKSIVDLIKSELKNHGPKCPVNQS